MPASGTWRMMTAFGAGDSCLLIEIQDGSVNDADGVRDGVVHDPLTLVALRALGFEPRLFWGRRGRGVVDPVRAGRARAHRAASVVAASP